MEYLVKKYKLQNNVSLMGAISTDDYIRELQDSIIGVLPCVIASNGDRDICPLTLQEAMAIGLPVISTNILSIPELVEHDISGILVPPKNVDELAKAILQLIENDGLRTTLGEQGRLKIIGEFNIENSVSRLSRYWSKILDAP